MNSRSLSLAITTAVVSLTAGGLAVAASKVTDVEYLRANRCKGLATGLANASEVTALTSFVKAEGRSRAPYIIERGEAEFNRARKEAKSEDRRERLNEELTGACQAYVSDAKSTGAP